MIDRPCDYVGWIPADHATAFVLNHDTERVRLDILWHSSLMIQTYT
jgi:hypothetical protein